MRLLVVSNYYPPCYFGGYELGCRDVVERLTERGHSVHVLTSSYRCDDAPSDVGISRELALIEKGSRARVHLQNARAFLRLVRTLKPDIVYFWNQSGLSLWLAPLAKRFGFRRAFFISDTSFVSWRVGAFLHRVAGKSSLRETMLVEGKLITADAPCHFASDFLKQLHVRANRGAGAKHHAVIPWGIDPELFRYRSHAPPRNRPFRVLFVGQLIPEKGVDVAIEAIALLRESHGQEFATLTIIGGSSRPEYVEKLQRDVEERGLSRQVYFFGKCERAQLPAQYDAHDALLMPSVWDEPFAITPLEAMACGVPVVATNTGGSAEIFKDQDNSLVVPPGDAKACADALIRLTSDAVLYDAIQERARLLVGNKYTLDVMAERIEAELQRQITANE